MNQTKRTVFVDGVYCAESEAKVSIFDRGYLFADAVYEVTCVVGGKLVDFHPHMVRLKRSLDELDMRLPMTEAEILAAHRHLVEANAVVEGLIYMQISRGPADRDFIFPGQDTVPTVIMFSQSKQVLENAYARKGISVISMPDIRWGRRDIKTVQLLYPSIAKTEAAKAGADDAWLVQDGYVTEASSANAYIVTADGKIVTRALSHDVLHGITRASVVKFAAEAGYSIEEKPFTMDEAKAASEAFITSATSFVTAVVRIDGVTIGSGEVGPVSRRLREIYIEHAIAAAI